MPTRDQAIYQALGDEPATVADLEERTGLPACTIRRVLRGLRAQGLISQHGGQGHPSTYERLRENR